jgi:hypothetical protein
VTAGLRRHILARAGRAAAVPVLVGALLLAPVGSIPAPAGVTGPATALAAGTCTGWPSDSVPPTAIRVLRTSGPASGTVQVVNFHDYATVVMAAEWGAGNPADALEAGAVAVKEYAWYHAMFWRGGTATDGSCYDLVDSSLDQIYAPETHVPAASLVTAVDATWGVTVRRNTSLFVTHYQAGANVACGANADGAHLYQVSATHCAQDGMTYDQILTTYYGPNVEVDGAQAPAAAPVGLRFLAQPAAAVSGLAFPVQPVVAVVDATGQTFAGDPNSQTMVALSLDAPPPGAVLTCRDGLSRQAIGGIATFDGCQVAGAAAPGVVLVASSAGLAPASTPPFAVAPAPPAVTLVASSTLLTWGQDVQLAAALVPPGVAGRERPHDASPALHGRGDLDARHRPADRRLRRRRRDGPSRRRTPPTGWSSTDAPDLAAATSPVVRVLVRSVVQLRPDSRGATRVVLRGATVTFSARIQPAPGPAAPASVAPARVTYRLYQLVGRSWVVKRTWTVSLDASGVASLAVTVQLAWKLARARLRARDLRERDQRPVACPAVLGALSRRRPVGGSRHPSG